jgi:hypothetical protein
MCDREHTPIVSEAQRRKFLAERSRRRKGLPPEMPSISDEVLEAHIQEVEKIMLPERR